MRSRTPDRTKSLNELDLLNAKLAEVRAESRRLEASRVATERKLREIGKNIAELKTELTRSCGLKPRARR